MTTTHDYSITAYNADGEPLSLRPHHITDFQALCAEGHEVGPYDPAAALAYVREVGRKGVRMTDAGDVVVQPVASYRIWAIWAPGHFEEYAAPRPSAHSVCLHDSTKAARAACRRSAKGN